MTDRTTPSDVAPETDNDEQDDERSQAQSVAEEARNVIPKWRANKELLRKHFLLELNGKTGAGVYIWPSVEAAKKAHDEEWRQSVIKRTGGAPTFRYFDLFLLIDNEKGEVIEFPEAAEIRSAAA